MYISVKFTELCIPNCLVECQIKRMIIVRSRRYKNLTIVVHDIIGAVRRFKRLRDDQQHVEQVAHKHETTRGEFHHTYGDIAEIESIQAEYAKENAQQHGRLIGVVCHVAAFDRLVEADCLAVVGLVAACDILGRIACHLS